MDGLTGLDVFGQVWTGLDEFGRNWRDCLGGREGVVGGDRGVEGVGVLD